MNETLASHMYIFDLFFAHVWELLGWWESDPHLKFNRLLLDLPATSQFDNLHVTKVLLCQLSYRGVCRKSESRTHHHTYFYISKISFLSSSFISFSIDSSLTLLKLCLYSFNLYLLLLFLFLLPNDSVKE